MQECKPNGGLEGHPASPNRRLQERLGHLTDVVEVRLISHISEHSDAFFDAMTSQDELAERMASTLQSITSMRWVHGIVWCFYIMSKRSTRRPSAELRRNPFTHTVSPMFLWGDSCPASNLVREQSVNCVVT